MTNESIARHWFSGSPGSLIREIDAGLVAGGLDPQALTPDDLAGVDEFHIRGREATAELAALSGFGDGDRLVDVGSGLGGPARYLARHLGCRVEGIDLTEEYCRTADELTRRLGLADRVAFRQGDALALPFESGSFDGAWTQHISMNIADKRAFFAEMKRVVRPGGRLAIYDPIAGSGGELVLPVPWARTREHSHLLDAPATRAVLEGLGLAILEWRDVSAAAVTWFSARLKAPAPPPLGLHLLLGSDWPAMMASMMHNLSSGRLRAVQILAGVKEAPEPDSP